MKNLTQTTEIKQAIERTIDCNEKYHGAYFWQPDMSAKGRRYKERNFTKNNPDYTFSFNDYIWTVEHRYDESCHHCYFQLRIFKDDHKTNITALKNVLKKLEEKEKKDWEFISSHLPETPVIKPQPKPERENLVFPPLPPSPVIKPRLKVEREKLVIPILPETINLIKK
ncbi:MAG TPA: hypothetical protein VIK14_12195 [Ignavibacteria bacterium]